MVKIINSLGKFLYLLTSLFPVYLFIVYIFLLRSVNSFNYLNLITLIIFCILSISSPIIFFKILIRNRQNFDKEIFIKSSKKDSRHLLYVFGSLSPLILFLVEFVKNKIPYETTSIIGVTFFVLIGILLIYKDDEGILYNLFFIFYKISKITDKKGFEKIIISKKDTLSGYIKVNQLNKNIFREWN